MNDRKLKDRKKEKSLLLVQRFSNVGSSNTNKTECDKEVCSVCYKRNKKRIVSNVSVRYTCVQHYAAIFTSLQHTCTHAGAHTNTVDYKNRSPAFTTADQQHDDNGNYHCKML
jgi:hypothetical protein